MLETAFSMLKDDLCEGVAVKLANRDKPFVVDIDTRVHAFGADIIHCEGEHEYPAL